MSEHGDLSHREERTLHAYHDGELNALSRWWWERRLAGSAELRAELAQIRAIGERLQGIEGSGPTVDLWDKIALSLPGLDAQRREASSQARAPFRFGRPLFAVAATAVLAVALVLGTMSDTPVQDSGVVRWLDTGGRSVIVLDEPDGATIVWLLEGPSEGAARGGLREAV